MREVDTNHSGQTGCKKSSGRARRTRQGAAQAAPPHVIDPSAIYFEDDLIRFLGFGKDGFRRLVRQGRLRASLPRGELLTLGAWLLEWIRASEVKKGASGSAAA